MTGEKEKYFVMEEKIENIADEYRKKGYILGENCVIEPGTLIEGESVVIGNDVHIGKGCVIRSKEICIGDNCLIFDEVFIHTAKKIAIGERGKISRNCTFRGSELLFGKELWCNEGVDIGGGGCWQNTAILKVGNFVHIGKSAMINICRPVYIGNKTGIGIESMIFTHSAGNGQSVLDGYKHIEREVWIGNHVSLYTRAFVTPGTYIEDGVTVGAMSYVGGRLTKGLYVGIPAKLKKTFMESGREEKHQILCEMLLEIFDGKASVYSNETLLNKQYARAILINENFKNENAYEQIKKVYDEFIIVNENSEFQDDQICVFDIAREQIYGTQTTFSEEIRDCLRRNGILLDFGSYQPKKLDYNLLKMRGVER